MCDSDEFSEKAYPSVRLSSIKKSVLQHHSEEREHGITAIRGRKYRISPHKPSPTKRKSRLSSGSSRRAISFDKPSRDNTRKSPSKERQFVTMPRAQVEENTESKLIENYGAEVEAESKKSARAQSTQQRVASITEEVVFSSTEREDWQPISPDTLTVIHDILATALRQSTGELTGVTEKKAERCLQNVVKEVNAELEVSIAPKLKQPKVSRAKQITTELKTQCVSLLEENSELEERLTEATRAVEELESRRELLLQLEDSDGTQLSPETTARAVDVLRERKKFQKYISRFLNT